MITFAGVDKSFGEVHVLRDLNLRVGRGEKVSIIGPSGSGKTTILRILMTLESPTSGRVSVGDGTLWDLDPGQKPRETKAMRQIRSKIGMVFQQFNLFPHMTAIENITEAPIHVQGKRPEEARRQARSLLDLVGLADHADKRPAQLSGGQQQRVAIARAMALEPEVLLFDEPTSALDPELVGGVLNVIRDVAAEGEMTILMVTHEMRFAQEISDRVVMFDEGVAIEDGPPAQIFGDPTHERTRRFLQAVLEA